MFQPLLRPRSEEEWGVLEAEREYAAAVASDEALTALIDGLMPDPLPGVPVPSGVVGWAWEGFTRAIPSARRAEATLLVRLLEVHRATEDDTIARFGVESIERNRDIDNAFRHEAALALDVGDAELTTLVWHLDRTERWLPKTWAAFTEGRLNRRALQTIAREMDGLDLDRYAAAYDAAAVDAIERTRGTALRMAMHTAREGLQASSARERKKKAEQLHGTQVQVQPDGNATWTITASAEHVLAAEDIVEHQAIAAAGKDGETRSIGQLKATIALGYVLRGGLHPATVATPGGTETDTPRTRLPKIVPTVNLTIPALTLLGRDTAPASLEGYGPIDSTTARLLAANAPSLARILTDPVTGYPIGMDRKTKRISKAMRRWLRFRDQHCRFPGCHRPAAKSDIDHTKEWVADAGPTNEDNLAHLCRRHHVWKSKGIFRIDRDPDGGLTWTFPTGRTWTSPAADPHAPAPRWLLDVLRQHPDTE